MNAETIKYAKAQVAKVRQLPVEQRAQMWCDLNRYDWPGEFDHIKPTNWDGMKRYDKNQNAIYLALWNEIVRITPDKDCRRAWNAGMTDAEFEEYWQQINQR